MKGLKMNNRPVQTYIWKRLEDDNYSSRVKDEIGTFLSFGCDYIEYETGIGNFSTAIIELDDGIVRNIAVDDIDFLD